MDKAVTCDHLNKLAEGLGKELWQSKENLSCQDCGCPGPNLWICLQPDCRHIGCSEVKNDHSTIHQKNYPSHCVHMNISTERTWCYLCEKEVYIKAALNYINSPPDSTTIDDVTIGARINPGLISPDDEAPDEMDYDDPRPRGLVGLQNMGNTCYMNAALQALSHTQPLTSYFLECAAAIAVLNNENKPGVSRAYQKLIKEMWSKRTRGYVVPNGILYGIRNVHPMFRGYHQHDTQEFLRCFMDQLHEELKEPVWEPCPEDKLTSEADGDHDNRNVLIRRRAASSGASDAPFFGRMRRKSPAPSSYNDAYFRVPEAGGSRHRRSASFAGTQQFAYNVHHVDHHINNPSPRNDMGSDSECSSEHEDRYETCSSGNSDADVHKPKQSYAAGAGDGGPAARYRSIVSDVFDGKLLSSVQCLICNRVSTRVETFQDLSLPIPSREHLAVIRCQQPLASHTRASQDSWVWWVVGWLRSWFYGPVVSLQDCLAAFFSADELKGDNMYSCSRCNKLRNGIKTSGVVRLPEVLCVHLKRFRHELMFSAKVAARVSFPIHNLDMQPYVHKDCTSKLTRYALCAVISHAGTAGGGHYTCAAGGGARWHSFDDHAVARLTPQQLAALEAYVLFYRKVNPQMDVLRHKAAEILESVDSDPGDTKYYISKQWINKFNTWAEPGAVDNSDFLCRHGGVRPERARSLPQLAARVPGKLWDFLHSTFGGGPSCTVPSECATCARAAARVRLRRAEELATFTRLHGIFQEQESCASLYALSMAWFRLWQAFVRSKAPPPPPVDNTPLLAKQEIDGKTTYVLKPGSDHAQLNEELWRFFIDIYGGGPEVRIKTQHCNPQTIDNDTKDNRRTSRKFDKEYTAKCNSEVNIRDSIQGDVQMNQSLQNINRRYYVSTSKTESDDDVHYTFHYKHEPNGNFQDSDEEMDTNTPNTIRMENGIDSDHDANDNPVKTTDKVDTELPNLDSISLKGKVKKPRRAKRRAVK